MDDVTLLHISDLHFQSDTYPWGIYDRLEHAKRLGKPAYSREIAENLAHWISINREKFDAILITGDLGHTGHSDDLRLAHNFVYGQSIPGMPYKGKGIPPLSASGRSVVVLPGNHDRFVQKNLRKPRSEQFEKIFSDYWKPDDDVAFGIIKSRDSGTNLLGIVLGDFSLKTASDADDESHLDQLVPEGVSYLGQGRVYNETLSRMEEVTKKLKRKLQGRPIVWAVHFSFAVKDRKIRLIDEDNLIASAETLEVACVFNGHEHRAKLTKLRNKPKAHVLTAGSATCNWGAFRHQDNSFQIIRLNITGSTVNILEWKRVKYEKNCFKPLIVTLSS